MRVKKRVKRGVKKGIKSVKSAPPGAYVTGGSVLVGVAAVLLLATTKSGQELLNRTAQRLLPEADEEESQESDVPRGDVEPEESASSDDESEVTDLKSRDRRPSPSKAPAPPKATNA